MLNHLWLALMVLAVLIGGFTGRVQAVVQGAVDSAASAVTLALGLIGIMALWLGVMRLAEKAGLIQTLARALRPVLRWLFPDVPAQHPAMGAIVMNLAANMLGLINAATPLGLRAMKDLESLNPRPGTATDAMCTFLAINTSSVQLIPMSAVAILAAAGATHPSAIIGTAFLATLCSTAAGIAAVKTLQRLPRFRLAPLPPTPHIPDPQAAPGAVAGADAVSDRPAAAPLPAPWIPGSRLVLAGFGACFVWFFLALSCPEWTGQPALESMAGQRPLVRGVNALSLLAIPFLVGFFPLCAALRRIPVYEEFVEGAKEGFDVAVRIIPFLVAMLVAIGMFRGAGGVDLMSRALQPVLDGVHFPAELVPMALVRPLSGSASVALLSDLARQFGGDSLVARMAGTLLGSTETTLYVVAVYFGAVGVKRTRHAVAAGLIADAVGVVAAVAVCRMVFA
ncbi:MAG: nucleoside recognition protein [Verrucomicrobia bacterium]|nr:nucleoside recognition protein [Verrucomicrobiota bacterium]